MRKWIAVVLVGGCASGGTNVNWEDKGSLLLSGIEDRKRSSCHFTEAASYDEFRKTHSRVSGNKRDTRSDPLPDFDFSARDLVIVWSGTMLRSLEIVSVKGAVVEARETIDPDEDKAARILGAGNARLISIPKSGKPVEVRWVR